MVLALSEEWLINVLAAVLFLEHQLYFFGSPPFVGSLPTCE